LGEEVAVPLHELLERRLDVLAALPTLEEVVQVGDHVPESRELLGIDVPHPLGELPEVRAEDLLLQVVHQLVEQALRLRIHEAVLLELADLSGDVGWERVQRRLAEPRIVTGLERQARPLSVQDLVQPLPELFERTRPVQPRLLFVTALLEPPPQGTAVPGYVVISRARDRSSMRAPRARSR